MALRDIEYKEDYRSGCDNIIGEVFKPSLREANEYWRAVGYFSSSAFESFGAPLGEFIKNGGSIRLVTSVELSESDLQAIESGAAKEQICSSRLDEIIDAQFAEGIGDGISRLGALLELGRLEIKIAIPKQGTGIYHEKIGLFLGESDYVAFSGSSNESRNAFENNRECIDVYTCWDSPKRAARKKAHFEDVWSGTDPGIDLYTFPEALKQKLIRICDEYRAGKRTKEQVSDNDKWRHQTLAVEKFLEVERGVINMATGTGKTRTALRILTTLFNAGEIDSVIVAMDGTDLLHQWYAELLSARKNLEKSVTVFRDYDQYKEVQDFSLSPSNTIFLVSRKASPSRDPLASALKNLSAAQAGRTLLVHDEVHKLGSPSNRLRLDGLSQNIRYRLGLSATPEREYDQEGNQFTEEHIGPEIEECRFELSDAIERGILVPFDYFPLHYELTAEDRQKVRDVYKKKAAKAAAGEPMSEEQVWIEIARVYKTSSAKLPIFSEFIAQNPDLLRRCIIFVETQEFGDEVLEIVHRHRPDFHTYFSGEQSETLKRFATGELECLITCHRVSEGIDIQSLNSVILFASAKARLETIQRMGRCLRFDSQNPDKVAKIVDFIRHSHDDENMLNSDEERRDWLIELSRVRARTK